MALEVFHIKIHTCFVPIVCFAVLLCSWQSNANSDGTCGKLTRCPEWLRRKRLCYCPNGYPVKFTCVNGKWKNLPCAPQCPKLKEILYSTIKYSNESSRLPGTTAQYKCIAYSHMESFDCESNGQWNRKEPESNMCYCKADPLQNADWEISFNPSDTKSGFYVLKTVATYFCKGSNKKIQLGTSTCENKGDGKGGVWTTGPSRSETIDKCRSQRPPTTIAPRCPKLKEIIYGAIKYSNSNDGSHHPGSSARYKCIGYRYTYSSSEVLYCQSNGQWSGKEPESRMCYCKAPLKNDNLVISYNPSDTKSGFYVLKTVATYFCKGPNKKIQLGTSTCENKGDGKGGVWTPGPSQSESIEKCRSQRPTIRVQVSKTTKPPIHHTDERTVIIVSGTTGAILGALIILVVIVSCQRRIHYHRMRRARIRHRQDQDAFTAFITYHRDARLLLPSYDEAINQEEQGQPPSFEEALGHYEEPTLPPGHTSAEDGCPSDTQDTSSAPPASETRSPPETSTSSENYSDTSPLLDSQTSPASENSRLFRSLRALFGGRTFRPDAIYCRFVPDDTGESESQTSTRAVETEPPDSSAELAEVLTRAGLC